MKLEWCVFFLFIIVLLAFPVSAAPLDIGYNISSVNNTFNVIDWFSGGIVRNSSGALYTTFNDDQGGFNFICYLAWSTDNGATWNKTSYDCNKGNPSITIDSNDKIHLTSHNINYAIQYRNYTLADGFGDPYAINKTSELGMMASQAVDSTGKVHIVYWGSDLSMSNNFIVYRNVSPTHELGDPILIDSNPFTLMWGQVRIDTDDNVHLVWADVANGLFYRNFTSNGLGNKINMNPNAGIMYRFFIDPSKKLHILYSDIMAGKFYYTNTTAEQNFQAPLQVEIPFVADGLASTMSMDHQNTIHFVWTDGATGVYYCNLSSNGLSAPKLIDDTAFTQLYIVSSYVTGSTGNILDDRIGFAVMNNVGQRIFYGTYPFEPIPTPTPAPVPTSPFNTVTVESTSQLVQMVITLGILLSILAIIAMLILKFITPGGE